MTLLCSIKLHWSFLRHSLNKVLWNQFLVLSMRHCLVSLQIPSWSRLQDQKSMLDCLRFKLCHFRQWFEFSLLFLFNPYKLIDMFRHLVKVQHFIQPWIACCKNRLVQRFKEHQRLQCSCWSSMWNLLHSPPLRCPIMQGCPQNKLSHAFKALHNPSNMLASNLRLHLSLIWIQRLLSQSHQLPHLIQPCWSLQVEIACLVYRPQFKLSMIGVGYFRQLKMRVNMHRRNLLLKRFQIYSKEHIKWRLHKRCTPKILPPVVLKHVRQNCLQSLRLNFRQSLFRIFHRNQVLLLDIELRVSRLFILSFLFRTRHWFFFKCILTWYN